MFFITLCLSSFVFVLIVFVSSECWFASLEAGSEYAGRALKGHLGQRVLFLCFALLCVCLDCVCLYCVCLQRVFVCLSWGRQWVCRGRALKGHLGRHLGNKTVLLPLKSFYHSTPILHSVSAVDLLHILTPQCTRKKTKILCKQFTKVQSWRD